MLGVSLKPCTDSGIVAMHNELQQLSQNLAPNSANIAAAREQVFQVIWLYLKQKQHGMTSLNERILITIISECFSVNDKLNMICF